MGETSIPKPVLFGILGLVVIAAAFFLLTKNKSDDSGSTTTTPVPATTPPPKADTTKSTDKSSTATKATVKADKAAITKTTKMFFAAAADGDAAKACAQLTPAAQADIVSKVEAKVKADVTCEQVIPAVAENLSPQNVLAFNSIVVTGIAVDGDKATAERISNTKGNLGAFKNVSGKGSTAYVRQGDGWLLGSDESAPSTGTTGSTKDAAQQTTQVDPTSLPKNVQKALDADKIVTVLFWRPQGVEDRDMQKVTAQLRKVIKGKDAKHFAVFEPGVGAITRWIKITGVEGVSQTPSYIVIGKGGKADVQTGFLDGGTMVNAIANDFRAFSDGRTALAKLPTN